MTVQELIKELQSVDPNKNVEMRISSPGVCLSANIDLVQDNKDCVSLHWQYKFGEDE